MRTLKVHLSIGLMADRNETIEVEDTASIEDIEDEVRQWAQNYIEYSWEPDFGPLTDLGTSDAARSQPHD